jgi:predicted dehydrogenase
MIEAAIIGLSEGNGHPFSYSSIVNGFSDQGLAQSGWPGIYRYVRRRHPSEFGIDGLTITHAWTQDPEVTQRLCAACKIPHAASDLRSLIGNVGAIILARDDFPMHYEMASPFLQAGLPVFIDKPLSLDLAELRLYRPYLESGQLMSCSGMRYARELDEPRADLASYGRLKLVRGAVVLSWEKYGVHLLDAVLELTKLRPVSVVVAPAAHMSATIRFEDGVLFQLDALEDCPSTFHIELFGNERTAAFDITDNFSMFRRMLWEFSHSIQTGIPAIPAQRTLDSMRVLIAGRMSAEQKREVSLDEITL